MPSCESSTSAPSGSQRIAVDFDALNMEPLESVAPVAVAPGSYEADCKKAWPMPWPLNLLNL